MTKRLTLAGMRNPAVLVALGLVTAGACAARREAGPADAVDTAASLIPTATAVAPVTESYVSAATASLPSTTEPTASLPSTTEPTAAVPSTTEPNVPAPTNQPSNATLVLPGVTTRSVTVDGIERSYRLYVPVGLPSGRVPVVMMFHGGLGSAEQAEAAYGWDALADGHGFVVVYPDGVRRTWNAGRCCGPAARDDVDDVGFVRVVLDDLDGVVERDASRTFATGMSNGALLSYRLACETNWFAAITAVAGTMVVDECAGRPTSVLAVHGLEDSSVRFDGSPGDGLGRVDGWPIADVISHWRAIGDCATPVDVPTTDPHVVIETAQCPDRREVTLVLIDDAGHQWPGGEPGRASADPPSERFDTTTYAWEFFAAHAAP